MNLAAGAKTPHGTAPRRPALPYLAAVSMLMTVGSRMLRLCGRILCPTPAVRRG